LEKTEQGRIFILERMINYGPGKEKIKLADVKKYWNKLHLFRSRRMYLEHLIWGKISKTSKNECKGCHDYNDRPMTENERAIYLALKYSS